MGKTRVLYRSTLSKTDVVATWLKEFGGKGTSDIYRSILRKFERYVGCDLSDYLEQNRDFLADFKSFVGNLEVAPKTALLYASVVKEFLTERAYGTFCLP